MYKKNYIVDIRLKQKKFDLSKYIDNEDCNILSLTPYSTYLIDKLNKKFMTFHDIIPVEKFHNRVMAKYKEYEEIFDNYKDLGFIFRDFAFLITHQEYIEQLEKYLLEQKKQNIEIYYITDANYVREKKIDYLRESYLLNMENIDKHIIVKQIDKIFYRKNKIKNNFSIIKNRNNILDKIIKKYINKEEYLTYDNQNFLETFNQQGIANINVQIDKNIMSELYVVFENYLNNRDEFFNRQYLIILNNIKSKLLSCNIQTLNIKPFTYLSDKKSFFKSLIYKKNDILKVFTQHGCYLYNHIFLKYNEIYPADINLVLNKYTQQEFLKYKPNNVHIIESINFNYPIKELKKEYDFLYITHCATYTHNATYIDGKQSYYSMDAYNIYDRHKKIIELFGIKFKDKKICIKIQSGIIADTMLYVPFLELSEKYKNINIEFFVPIKKLISKSKYIISDYFSSEFINRELHYKRDIILFKSAPLMLPVETIKDMSKMFILVETVDDLAEKVKDIENITKDRLRYDDIIEYYSSTKCDTKKVVKEILEKNI